MDLCPAKAIEIDPKSKALVINNEKCRGCKTCVTHCPLEVARFNEDSGVAFKCDLCGGDPVCAKFCPSGAIKFLALDEGLDTRGRDFMEQVAKATGETSKDST
jgi:Fe-S-cluster-containing dehydrogenase component